ncbi:MAG: PilC/PilY family type IV pilus protein [Methylococcales bacterium]
MKHQFIQSTLATFFTLCLFSISQSPVQAAPGNLGHIPLFVAPPTPPNIFFMLDDSGSMNWTMPSDGISSTSLIDPIKYDLIPDNNRRWYNWCLGANLMAYNPNIVYKPWSGTIPGTSTPFPDQTDVSSNLTQVWVDPSTGGGGFTYADDLIYGNDSGTKDISNAPVVQWSDTNNNGQYDAGECPNSFADSRVQLANSSSLSASQKKNFANWFSYYRIRAHATKAAVTRVIANSSARMGMATLHGNNGVGIAVKDMTDATNKTALLDNIVNINSTGGTPLRKSLNWVGEYYKVGSNAPSGLNIGAASSPILSAANGGECQQNFTMLMTDGQWNGGSSGLSSSEKNQDKTIDNQFVYPAHKDTVPHTLADVAMKWYKTDLAPTLAGKVPVQSGANTQNLDENNQQHMVTFGIAFGPTGTLNNGPVDRTQLFTWPTPTSNSIETVDDLRHAAYNGRGQFLSANNPETLISALQNVISDIESRQGSASTVSFNSAKLAAGTSLFFASFDTVGWSGNLRAFSVDPITGDLGTTPIWSAASLLDSKTNTEILSRTIYTWGQDSTGTNNGVLFDWSITNPQPTANILADFKINQDASSETTPFTNSQFRLNYVRGDTSQEGVGLIRNRASRLGDIIHSSPRFVGVPDSNWPDTGSFGIAGSRYSSYQSSLETTPREGIVYVGANDGLLHGFKASNGEEVFSYLPSATASALDNTGLHYLTEVDYQHRYYVDGLPISADVYMPVESAGTSDWRTILVGALGGGGQGLYALDVTDPTQFTNTQAAAKKTVLWEFTNQDDPDLGYSFSVPQIARMNNDQWAVIIGNGYNATGTDTAELMILFIEKGIDGTWSAGDYIKLDTMVGNAGTKNGLSTPTLIDLDNNGTTDRVYAGDLLGNMWAFDVSNTLTSSWKVAYQDGSTNPAPLFTTTHYKAAITDPGTPVVQVSATPQPITMKPLLLKSGSGLVDDVTNKPNVMVYFGTGQYIATGDATNTNQQTFYGILDAGIPVPATKLVEQTFITNANIPIGNRVLTQNPVIFPALPNIPADAGIKLGWFINLPETGERVIVDAFEHLGVVFFNTMTPSSVPCAAGGESWLMATDMKTGGNPTGGAFDTNGDGNFDNQDQVSDGTNDYNVAGVKFAFGIASATAVISNQDGKSFAYISGTGGAGGTGGNSAHKFNLNAAPVISGSRRSWIQLFN